jgi:TonB family protein
MKSESKTKQSKSTWIISISVTFVFLFVCYSAVKALISDDGSKRRRHIQMVTLIKPPPPPKIEEKPPEPEIEEKEEIIEPEPEEVVSEEQNDAPPDDAQAGDNLGVDADGAAGSDAFGLVGKKGGRALLAGYGDRTLMQRYAWYTRIIQEEIRKRINDHMSRNGGIPDGDHKALIKIVLDPRGNIIDFRINESSGNDSMDRALAETLHAIRISESPPAGMPRSIKLKISSRG